MSTAAVVVNGSLGDNLWLATALERRLTECGPHVEFPPDTCPWCERNIVLSQEVNGSGQLLWWCASQHCRRTGLAAGWPAPIVRETGGFYGRAD